MSKSLKITVRQWSLLQQRLLTEYPKSTILIREKMRKTLGFVSRDHLVWTEGTGYKSEVHLDFYDEPKKTMFALKYSEFIHEHD